MATTKTVKQNHPPRVPARPAAHDRTTTRRHPDRPSAANRRDRRCPRCGHRHFTAALSEHVERVYLIRHAEGGVTFLFDEEILLGRAIRFVCRRCETPLPVLDNEDRL